MPVEIVVQSKAARKSVELVAANDGYQIRTKNIPPSKFELYKLTFVFRHHQSNNLVLRLRENYEYLAWVNSPQYNEARELNWVTDRAMLPIYDNELIYLPHHVYHELCDTRFLKIHCDHIRSLAPETSEKIGGQRAKGRAA